MKKSENEVLLYLGLCTQPPIPEAIATTTSRSQSCEGEPTEHRKWFVRVVGLEGLLAFVERHGPVQLSLERAGTALHPTLEWTGNLTPHEDCG